MGNLRSQPWTACFRDSTRRSWRAAARCPAAPPYRRHSATCFLRHPRLPPAAPRRRRRVLPLPLLRRVLRASSSRAVSVRFRSPSLPFRPRSCPRLRVPPAPAVIPTTPTSQRPVRGALLARRPATSASTISSPPITEARNVSLFFLLRARYVPNVTKKCTSTYVIGRSRL